MRRGLLAIFALVLCPGWALAQGHGAAPSNPPPARPEVAERPAMRFEWVREGPASECRDRCRAWISAAGRITESTPADFEAFIQGLDLRGATVVLDSGGGLVEGGLALGRAIRRLGLATTVGRTVWLSGPANGERRATLSPRGICASMCAFALLGGVRRHVPDEARVLVHQIWPSKLREDATAANYTAGNMMRIQRELGHIARYTVEMGADIELFEIAMRIPPWENLRPLRSDELRRLRVHNSDSAFGGTTAESVAPSMPTRLARIGPAVAPAEGARGWALATSGGRSALTRRHPLTIEGQDIGSFEIALGCSDTADMYQVIYREKRFNEVDGATDRLNGVRMMIGREPVRLKIDSSSVSSGELVSSARGLVAASLASAFAAPGGGSLLVETITANKQRTAIRVGPAGLSEGFRDMTASCPK